MFELRTVADRKKYYFVGMMSIEEINRHKKMKIVCLIDLLEYLILIRFKAEDAAKLILIWRLS